MTSLVSSTRRGRWRAALVACTLPSLTAVAVAQPDASTASRMSALPIAVSIEAPVALLAASAALTVVGVEASADGAICVLERASDGARATLRLGTRAAGGLSLAAGSVVTVTALGTGWLLSQAGRAIAFVPNTVGAALFHHAQLTP